MKYHITVTGDINPCVQSACPIADRPHYWTPEQAVIARIQLAAAGRIYLGTLEG